MTVAVTLFNLAGDRTLEDYRRYSKEFIRPGMEAMPSVVRFRDYHVSETYDSGPPSAALVEVIEITDIAAFRRDNETGPGAEVAEDWARWCSSFEVLFCEELL